MVIFVNGRDSAQDFYILCRTAASCIGPLHPDTGMDRASHPHSEKLRVTETFRRVEFGHMQFRRQLFLSGRRCHYFPKRWSHRTFLLD
jgi:hypothetical protein